MVGQPRSEMNPCYMREKPNRSTIKRIFEEVLKRWSLLIDIYIKFRQGHND